jgi:hypothetical protein
MDFFAMHMESHRRGSVVAEQGRLLPIKVDGEVAACCHWMAVPMS